MPLYVMKCSVCGLQTKRMLAAIDPPQACRIPGCGGTLRRDAQPPTSSVKEVIDLGTQTKRVERYVDAERLYEERSKQDNTKA